MARLPFPESADMLAIDDEDIKEMRRARVLRILALFTFMVPLIALVVFSPLPIAWLLDGGTASITTTPDGPQASGEIETVLYTTEMSTGCDVPITGPIVVFIGPSAKAGNTAAIGLVPNGGGLMVRGMEIPETVRDWSLDNTRARVLLPQDPTTALLPRPERVGSYWRLRGSISYGAALRESGGIAPLGITSDTQESLLMRTQPVVDNATVSVEIDMRWLAARQGPFGIPVYCN